LLDDVIQARFGLSALAQVFSLGDERELRALLTAAGCTGIEIQSLAMTARFPDPDGFLAGEIAVDTAAIPAMQQLDAAARKAMTDAIAADMDAPLREHVRDGHVELEFYVLLARARA
jgi:hypothetical protein